MFYNVITLEHTKSDNTSQMITITDEIYLVNFSKRELKM